jgi:hypothetical protein
MKRLTNPLLNSPNQHFILFALLLDRARETKKFRQHAMSRLRAGISSLLQPAPNRLVTFRSPKLSKLSLNLLF